MSDSTVLTDVDVVVLGMGPGGEDVAGDLASAALSVVGIDNGLVGGECPYWGCIPSKMMIRAAHLLAEARRIPGLADTPYWTNHQAIEAETLPTSIIVLGDRRGHERGRAACR